MTARDTSTLRERLASTDRDVEIVETVRRSASEWVVVSIESGTPRVWVVDTRALSCDCPRGNERARSSKACVHLTHVLVTKSNTDGFLTRIVMHLSAFVERVRGRLDPIPEAPSIEEPEAVSDGGATLASEPASTTWTGLDEWVSLAEHWYASQGFDVEALDIRVDRSEEAIAVRAGGLDEEEFRRFAQVNRQNPWIKWDEEGERNLIYRADVGEVFGG